MVSNSKIKIFLVDDDLFTLRMYDQHLQNIGYHFVDTIGSGRDCLAKLGERPDVIFLDYNLGDITGFEVLTQIKRVDPSIYVVMLSGQESIAAAVDALKFGAFDYVVKDDKVEARIENVLLRIAHVQDALRKQQPNWFLRLLTTIL